MIADVSLGPFGSVDDYRGLTGPRNFGAGGSTNATSATGPIFFLGGAFFAGGDGLVAVPSQYTSFTSISDSATWANTTISDLGLTPGDYKWTWGSGTGGQFIEVVIPAVPEPSSLILAGTGAGLVGYCMRIRRRRAAAAAA